jgi:tRNA pseudouridine55 synthase
MTEGILNINKPTGMTSHDVVAHIRRKFNIKRVGHAGTLDPLATGVLVILVGRSATKLSDQFMRFDKGYKATLLLGTRTDTQDTDGTVVEQRDSSKLTPDLVEEAMNKYLGAIDQLPPMYSAVKIKGKKLYEYARKGITIERKTRRVNIHSINLNNFKLPECVLDVQCSKGTYIRQLADDIGEDLKCGACISALQRTKVGPFTLDNSVELEEVDEKDIRDWSNYQARL